MTDVTQSECPASVVRSLPVFHSHNLTLLSELPVASIVPSGLNAADQTLLSWPLCRISSRAVVTFQIVTTPRFPFGSRPPPATDLPSGVNVTVKVQSAGPSNVAFTRPVLTSSILT